MCDIKQIVQKIRSHLSEINWIRGMVLTGSYARKEHDEFSDIDLYLFGDNKENWNEFLKDPTRLFKKIFGEPIFTNYLPQENCSMYPKCWMLNVSESYTKIDLHLISNFNPHKENPEIDTFWRESQIQNPSETVLLDKDRVLLSYFNKLNETKAPINIEWKFESEIRKFLFYYEIFLTYLYRKDKYRAYFLYNICLHGLVTLCYLADGNTSFLYSPIKILEGNINQEHKQMIIQASSSLKDNLYDKIDFIYDSFLALIENSSIPSTYSTTALKKHKKMLLQKTSLRNTKIHNQNRHNLKL